ncbi:MAG: SLC13 family permease [Lachnospiraceae bacterium]|nr:SLC13 family permease [Lachnospiraceae bacterium]
MQAKKCYRNLLISAVLYLLIALFLPAGNGLTELGVYAIATFVAIVYLWVANEQIWASILVFPLAIIAGLNTAAGIIPANFGNVNVVFVVTCALLGDALLKTGVLTNISHWMVTRKFLEGHPRIFIAAFIGSAMFFTFFISSVPIVVMYLSWLAAICDEIGYEKKSPFGISIALGIMVIGIVAEVSTPFSHPQVLILFNLIQAAGFTVSMAAYTFWGILFNLCIYAIILLVINVVIKDDFKEFNKYSAKLAEERATHQPMTKQGKIVLTAFVLTVIFWLGGDLFKPFSPEFAAMVSGWGTCVPCMVAIVLLNIIHIDDKPIYDIKSGLPSVPWGACLFLAGMMALSGVLTAENTGVSVWLGTMLAPIAQTLPPAVLLGIAILITIIATQAVTNFITLMVIWQILVPIMVSLNAAGGTFNIPAFGIALLLTANVAFLLPSSCSTAPLFFGSGHLDDKKMFYKLGIPIFILAALFCIFIFLPLTQAFAC